MKRETHELLNDFGLFFVFVVIVAIVSECVGAEFSIGTVLGSRNRLDSENKSPGGEKVNHLAIIVSPTEVVEAQAGKVEGNGPGVIRTKLSAFLARDYNVVLALEPIDPAVGRRAAATAETLVGLPFRQLSSLPGVDRPLIFERLGMNCDSVIRYSYRKASGEPLRTLRIPEKALEHPELFKPAVTIRNEPGVPAQTVGLRRKGKPLKVRAAILAPLKKLKKVIQ